MLSIICAPPSALQVFNQPPTPTLPPRLNPDDEQILEVVRERRIAPIWSVLNGLADQKAPRSRADRRELTLRFWERLRRLFRLRVVFRHNRTQVATTPPEPRPRQAPRRRRQRLPTRRVTATQVSGTSGDSTLVPTTVGHEITSSNHLEIKLQRASLDLHEHKAEQKNQTAVTPDEISAAAQQLARLPRHRKRWTGWLHGQHCWRGQLVVSPGGEVVPLIWCSRGRVLLRNIYDLPFREWLIWGARREHEVTLFKHPSAVSLGQMKRGVRERKSEAKARTARINGSRPTGNGRRRGRPRRASK